MTRRANAKAPALSALDVTRAVRRVLRDPRALMNMVLVGELHAESPAAVQKIIGSDSQLRAIVRAAVQLLLAMRRLAVVVGWPCFQAENPQLSGAVATARYVRRARISRSTLYRWKTRFSRHGILGLYPSWQGGRPGTAALAEHALLRDVIRAHSVGGAYGCYLLLSRRLNGKTRRIPQADAQREIGTIYRTTSATQTKGRRRARRPVPRSLAHTTRTTEPKADLTPPA